MQACTVTETNRSILQKAVVALLAAATFAFVLLLHGAVPFFATPAMSQALWVTGFAQSFANQSIFSIYATNFGVPAPAAIVFGLSGALPAAFLLRLGLHAADAYSLMIALWLAVAFAAAYALGRMAGCRPVLAILGAALWLSIPFVWAHALYSMLSVGIALLPFYFLAAWRLFIARPAARMPSAPAVALYVTAALIAVFTDGYTFVMFAAGASLLCLYLALAYPDLRKRTLTVGAPVHLVSLALAYGLYTSYVGKSDFEHMPLDFFRAWGVDLAYIAIPQRGMSWVLDHLGLSVARSDIVYFGDASVWRTTFYLALMLAGLFAWWQLRRRTRLATGLLLVASFGFYMALGPSLKINSTKSEDLQKNRPGQLSALMPAKYAVVPTGNAWLSQYVPGFRLMRASYRWTGLAIVGDWMLLMLLIGRSRHDKWAAAALAGLIGLNLPDLAVKWRGDENYRAMIFAVDDAFVAPLGKVVHRNELVTFLPYNNDFALNYVAAKLGIRTYNIGGDKNLAEAKKHWPDAIATFAPGRHGAEAIARFLLFVPGEAVVIPYFNPFHDDDFWSCVAGVEAPKAPFSGNSSVGRNMHSRPDCASAKRQEFAPLVDELKRTPYLDTVDANVFAAVRLRPEFSTAAAKAELRNEALGVIHYPIVVGPDAPGLDIVLAQGWHNVERAQVWSGKSATLTLPVPADCQPKACAAMLRFEVFGASERRPVPVTISADDGGTRWSRTIEATGGERFAVSVPLPGGAPLRRFEIVVPNARSPASMGFSVDGRTLGVALQRIDLVPGR